jgi:hypothetical protein
VSLSSIVCEETDLDTKELKENMSSADGKWKKASLRDATWAKVGFLAASEKRLAHIPIG